MYTNYILFKISFIIKPKYFTLKTNVKKLYADFITIEDFLPCETPEEWVDKALANQELMLIDHAHCEMKAASSAMTYLYKYSDKPDLITKMSKIAREELVHFEQVMRILKKRKIEFKAISASRYASELIKILVQISMVDLLML